MTRGEVRFLSRDKVTVDEPLISTDVDSLIRVIADKGSIPLNELRQTSRIDKKTLDKWIAVLEDEGYIRVEYGLRGTTIHWVEQATDSPKLQEPEAPPQEAAEAVSEEITPEPAEEVFISEEKAEAGEEFAAEVQVSEEPEPEELLSQYLARKRGSKEEEEHELKSNILNRLGEDNPKEVQHRPDNPEEPPEDEPEDEHKEPGEPEEPPEEPEESKARSPAMERVPASDVRELVGSYMKEINKEKASIESLKKDRESLYRDKLALMEGKLQADIVLLTEKVLEKEEKIAQLKERVLELPDKVDQLSRLQEQMETLKKEGRDALARTRSKADEFIVGVKESKDSVEKKIGEVESEIERQNDKLGSLEKLSASLDSRSEKVKSALESAKAQVEEISNAMNALMGDLDSLEQMKGEISSMTGGVKQTVASHGAELESLEQELEGIEKVEHWIQDYIRDYEDKLDSLEQYVAKSDDELSELKEAAESLYVKKFIGELENVTDAYEGELHEAIAEEKGIEDKIAASKARITELVKESQQMIRKLKGDVSETDEKDFGILVARVKARTERAKRTVQEKETERRGIKEESARTRKSRPVSTKEKPRAAPSRGSSKPVSKLIAKKKRK